MTETDATIAAGLTLEAALALAADRLARAGLSQARMEARRLAQAAGVSLRDVIVDPGRPLRHDERETLERMLVRRLRREPLSRILGTTEFYGRRFFTSPDTLDPRPESEILVGAALELVQEEGWNDVPIDIVDIGTGTGCLALTLLAELPNARGLATDVSREALAVARRNAEFLGLDKRLHLLRARSLEGVPGPFHLLVSNPPYIENSRIAGLAPEVRDFDPHLALDGGNDGLAIYRELAGRLKDVCPEGWVIFEVGAGQHTAVADMMDAGAARIGGQWPETDLRFWSDYGGHVRCVAKRSRP